MEKGACIVNTALVIATGHCSTTPRQGRHCELHAVSVRGIDRCGIRVNAVAPGPIWTPLIPASFEAKHVASHGASTPVHRPGQPNEVSPCYVFLASDQAYISGQVLHPNGGKVVGC
jgi:enoyl-[acyl-carrier-protein] reductase (NADH)